MSKKIRLAFAMGGGVSLGTFSGAALTETIKQFIMNHPDDDVEIDVFSGASAGAISLAVMLRIMSCYEDKIHFLQEMEEFKSVKIDKKDHDKTVAAFKDKIIHKLISQYGDRYETLQDEKKEQIISAQVAQEFQKLIWCYKIKIKALVGIQAKPVDLSEQGSLLDRGYLLDVARKIIFPSKTFKVKQSGTPLAQRVLFANTLTRVDPIKIDSAKAFSNFSNHDTIRENYQKIFEAIATDGTSSKSHRDIRIFDVTFTPASPSIADRGLISETLKDANRWIRAQTGANKAKTYDLNHKEFWSTVTATSIACGAFPIAFEQVPLARFSFEYGLEGNQIDNKLYRSTNPVMGQYAIYNYIDGGTFNNEPISEAFRLSSHIDANNFESDSERYVIYVDPFLTKKTNSRIKPFYQNRFKSETTQKTIPVTGLQKISSFIGPMIGLLRNEGSISELDKSLSVMDKFKTRQQLREFFCQSIDLGYVKDIKDLEDNDFDKIKAATKRARDLISEEIKKMKRFATITESDQLHTRIRKMLLEDANKHFFSEGAKTLARENKLQENESYIYFCTDKRQEEKANEEEKKASRQAQFQYIQDWTKCLFFISLDLSMDLIFKDRETKLIPIGPVQFNPDKTITPIALAGQPIEGFIGFFDIGRRIFDFDFGRLATLEILHKLNLGSHKIGDNQAKFNEVATQLNSQVKEYLKQKAKYSNLEDDTKLKEVMREVLNKRVKGEIAGNFKTMIKNTRWASKKNRLTGFIFDDIIDRIIRWVLLIIKTTIPFLADKLLAKSTGTPIELRILVTDKKYQIKNQVSGFFLKYDLKTYIKEEGELYLVTVLNYLIDEEQWLGSKFVKDSKVTLVSDKGLLSRDKKVAQLPLPSPAIMNDAMLFSLPILTLDLDAHLKNGIDQNEANWQIKNGIIPLEQQILNLD